MLLNEDKFKENLSILKINLRPKIIGIDMEVSKF
jgi:hypothetical protein